MPGIPKLRILFDTLEHRKGLEHGRFVVHQCGEGLMDSLIVVTHWLVSSLGTTAHSNDVPGRRKCPGAGFTITARSDHRNGPGFPVQRFSPINVLIRRSMASLARKMRERTVPTGQFMTVAISS